MAVWVGCAPDGQLVRGSSTTQSPSDLPSLLTDMILGACPKRSRQLEAQQEQEHEVGGPSRRAGSLLGRPHASSSAFFLF